MGVMGELGRRQPQTGEDSRGLGAVCAVANIDSLKRLPYEKAMKSKISNLVISFFRIFRFLTTLTFLPGCSNTTVFPKSCLTWQKVVYLSTFVALYDMPNMTFLVKNYNSHVFFLHDCHCSQDCIFLIDCHRNEKNLQFWNFLQFFYAADSADGAIYLIFMK